jgi:broad specificity phosphatase PhoE
MVEIYLARHGITEWSESGQHTGTTDIPLTPEGEEQAKRLGSRLAFINWDLILVSPRKRALQTAQLAGYGPIAEIAPDLAEWNYGRFEGLTTPQIRQEIPDWTIFKNGAPDGESVDQVTQRARRFLNSLHNRGERILCVSHGHILRAIAAVYIGFTAAEGRCFALDPAGLCCLTTQRETPLIRLWNSQ